MTVPLDATARALTDDRNVAVLATVDADGSPQSSPVWILRDGDDLLVSTAAGGRKTDNLLRDPRASLCVTDRNDPQRYVEVRGTATVTEDAGRAVAVAVAEKYEGPGAGEEYLALPPEVVRVVIRLSPTRVVG
jgi:PPOX class probable F420-dependent enzyme